MAGKHDKRSAAQRDAASYHRQVKREAKAIARDERKAARQAAKKAGK